MLETALYVEDMERAVRFYEDLFGFARMSSGERLTALSVANRQVLLLFTRGASTEPIRTPGGTIPPHDGTGTTHLAFSIPASELEAWELRLKGKGITVESKVQWDLGGQSLFFRDPDNHLVELATPGTWPIY